MGTIISLFSGWLGKGLLAGIAVAITLGVAWKIESDIKAVGALQATNACISSANKANAAETAKIQEDTNKADAAAADQSKEDQASMQQQVQQERIIENAPQADRGVVPGVILNTIDGLYNNPTGTSSSNTGS